MNREDIINLAIQAGYYRYAASSDRMHEFARLVENHERTRCVKICENAIANLSDAHPTNVTQAASNVLHNISVKINLGA